MIEFEQIFYTYSCSQKPTINNLSLQLKEGKRYALIGNNGSGKTTFLRLANGLYRPDRGVIRFFGQPLKYNHRGIDRTLFKQWYQQVGLVFQDPEQQLVATTVEEDLSYGLCNLGIPDDEIALRVANTLKEFNLEELAHFPVNYLSLGQKKRLAIADVMILKPKILLLDEPTAYLDPRQRKELIKQLQQISIEGTTILLATHDLDFIYGWADWIFVMDKGKIALQGTPDEVFDKKDLLEGLDLDIPLELKLRMKILSESKKL
ncbi:energy-coupling factor ABC transporter ATP-binding protein [Geminocystis sp. CENA526]|uniref:energy-coupling factor ABC transporter ATP-binding protein n=1 Tax=Geminocystis sp. CENA526 TaxID=1355871 RepID=UPI003D6EAF84